MRYVLYCLLFLFFAACQKEIDLTARNAEAKFVIWCYLHEDSIVSASLSKTSPPLSINADRIVKDALVVLYENDRPVDTLKYDSLTVYSSKKRFKPTVEKVYFIKVSKQGFPTLETFKDTMPPKPKLLSYIAQDSVAQIDNFTNLSRLRLNTDKPKYFPVYGLSPGKYIYPVINKVSYLDWQNGILRKCEDTYGVPNHSFIKSDCTNILKDIYEFTQPTGRMPYELRGQKMILSLASLTQRGAEGSKVISKLGPTLFTDKGTELFWSPIYTPETVKNGYGFLICYNTFNFEIQF